MYIKVYHMMHVCKCHNEPPVHLIYINKNKYILENWNQLLVEPTAADKVKGYLSVGDLFGVCCYSRN